MTTYTAHCTAGYYAYDRAVTVDKKLDRMPYAQAGILKNGNAVQLVSYETIVCEIADGWLHVFGTFSASTRRHIGAFLKECAPAFSYQDAKKCYADGVEMNVYTGEIRDAAPGVIHTIGIRTA